MAIVRTARPERNFYILDKRISEDKRLSWGACGLLVFLLGKPDHWKVSIQALVNETERAATVERGTNFVGRAQSQGAPCFDELDLRGISA